MNKRNFLKVVSLGLLGGAVGCRQAELSAKPKVSTLEPLRLETMERAKGNLKLAGVRKENDDFSFDSPFGLGKYVSHGVERKIDRDADGNIWYPIEDKLYIHYQNGTETYTAYNLNINQIKYFNTCSCRELHALSVFPKDKWFDERDVRILLPYQEEKQTKHTFKAYSILLNPIARA